MKLYFSQQYLCIYDLKVSVCGRVTAMERPEETSIPAASLAQKASLKTEWWPYFRQKKGQKGVSRPGQD